ncbi:MAG: DUF2891 domain-containing protein [Bacteroidetes bacterium]|jgi:hypothetical protein|nr:MAG: hypothetical protein ABR90_04375 [Cryomorphaceae bacterium BACL29 MAG-121220-bin8]MDA0758257.1 DUF2891 domain-containing protein [Bacteroidota bacterium]|tara:strand:+ start:44697 stop:45809 length:1113 start_codon:yes stop_codon:yes gene_type:complete
MKKTIIILLILLVIISCNNSINQKKADIELVKTEDTPILNIEEARRLIQLPLQCKNNEYPNKLGQTLGSDQDLLSPKTLHPSFYGCFDWHSSVHGHWSLVHLLSKFPNIENANDIKNELLISISKDNILAEVSFFNSKHNKSFERTYGWAWLLKLAEELHNWNDPISRKLEANLKPLTDLIIEKYIEFLPKLNYPLRIGTHSNTAFGLSFALDYAKTMKNSKLTNAIITRAKYFYLKDKECPMSWEPSGSDFLSPCLEEAALMKRLLSKKEFTPWVEGFIPELKNVNFKLETGMVSDRTDGQLVHLDGLNFSRAWSLNKIAEDLPKYKHLNNIANQHINYSLPSVVGDSYEGGHWLGSFAIYALNSIKNN